MARDFQQQIRAYYDTLFNVWGRQHWWPAESSFEVIVGAYLTQNTSWSNVQLALSQLRSAGVLSIAAIRRIPLRNLEKLVRSAGYFRQKARRLKAFVSFVDNRYSGSLVRMFAQPTAKLRNELLELNGVGPETADSILLYAGNHPVFVVDAYTRRIFERHGLLASGADYEEIRHAFESGLATVSQEIPSSSIFLSQGPPGSCHEPSRMSTAKRSAQAQVLNEMHGLIVGVGKTYCKKSQMRCEECPLRKHLPASSIRD